MNVLLNTDNDLQIEVKRLIVVHDLEKLANNMLSDINIEKITNVQYEAKKMCQQVMPWKDNQFWNELPNPNTAQKHKSIKNFKLFQQTETHQAINNKAQQRNDFLSSKQIHEPQIKDNNISQKYFEKWKIYIRNKKQHKNQLLEKIEQKEKLDKFFKMLKKCQHKSQKQNASIKLQYTRNTQNKSAENLSQNTENKPKIFLSRNKTAEGTCYQHRFKAQQDIIEIQKQKLMKQEKIIHELQFGKLNEEIKQSMEETKKEIKETLAKCSIKVKCQMKPINAETAEEDFLKFHLNSMKAPKIIQQMEKRALEREQKRQMIFERKRLLDQKKKEAIENEIEKKKILDEEERKIHLRQIKERRKREMEIQLQIQIRKQQFLDDCMKTEKFYRKKLLKFAFKGFLKLIAIKENNLIKSEQFYKTKLKRTGWNMWIKFIEEIERIKMENVIQLYNFKLKKITFRDWYNVYTMSIQHLQVAEDLYEMRLQSKIFIHWHRYICTEYVLQIKNVEKAQKHHNSRILFHCFYQWKSLPTVLQLEKAKEEKKRRWREKVWEILPDYNPPIED